MLEGSICMEGSEFQPLQAGITSCQNELREVEKKLVESAHQLAVLVGSSKVAIIVLGALVATRETAAHVFGPTSGGVDIAFAILGVLIASLAGMEAAFKWTSQAAEIRVLAVLARAANRDVDAREYKLASNASPQERLAAAQYLLELLDAKLTELQEKAAVQEMNVGWIVRDLKPSAYRAND
jgi:hypothetical protein